MEKILDNSKKCDILLKERIFKKLIELHIQMNKNKGYGTIEIKYVKGEVSRIVNNQSFKIS